LSNGELHNDLEAIEQAIVATEKSTIVAASTVASSSVATASSSSITPEATELKLSEEAGQALFRSVPMD
jgi:hypothetical protein